LRTICRSHARGAVEAAEKTVRAQQGFLRDVFRVIAPAQHPAGEVKRRVHMGQHELLEASSLL
jgi:hypothetical protein